MMIGTGIEAYINIGSGGQAVKKVKDINATEYTLQAEDVDFVLQFRADANIKILVPAGLPEDGRYEGKQLGDGMIALDNDEGVTIAGTDFATYASIAKNSHFALDWTAADTYVVNDFERLDATSIRKGGIRLAGDLAGTANNPTVPTKLNKATNPEYESLADTSEKHGFALFTRLGAIFRSPSLLWDETLKKLTIKGSQAIWEAYQDVTSGNMGIKALSAATEAFKIFDNIGNYFSVGTDAGKRLTRVFTAFRLMNGTSYNETEYKAVNCLGSVTTLLKAISVPENAILTVDVMNISIMNTDKDSIIGRAQFSFKNDAGILTNISIDAFRYGSQYTTLPVTDGYVTSSDTRIDASVSGTTANINFVNTVNRETNVQCEVKFTITLMPT